MQSGLATLGTIVGLLPVSAQAQAGFPVWTNRYNGPGNGNDFVSGICIDPSGNVIVTGYARASNGYDEYTTIKYSSAGMPLWTNRYGGPVNGHEQALALAVDSDGNAYVTGSSTGSGSGTDFATIKYSSGGLPLWTNRYTGSGNSDEAARAIAVDDAGRVYVAGGGNNFLSMSGFLVTIAYASNGIPLWTNRYNAMMHGPDTAKALAIADNHVYVTGDSISNGVSFDVVTIAYTNTGAGLWTNRFTNPGDFDDQASAIIATGGNIYVAGFSVRDISFETDHLTLAYSNAGIPLWTNRFSTGSSPPQLFSPSCLAADGVGNIYRAGYSTFGGGLDYATVAYSGSGLPLWTNAYHSTGADMAISLTTDSANNVFVAGRSASGVGSTDFAVLAYSQSGASIWTNRYHGPGTGVDSGRGIATDADGNVYVIGHSTGSTGNYDYAIIKYATLNPSPIPLHVQKIGNALVLSWTNTAFVLQAAPAISGAFTNIPSATSPHTNAMTSSQQFFRLKAN